MPIFFNPDAVENGLRLAVDDFINMFTRSFSACCQFHQHLRVNFAPIFWPKNISKSKRSIVIFGAKILYKKRACKTLIKLTPDPKSVKIMSSFQCLFVLLGSTSKTLMKLTQGGRPCQLWARGHTTADNTKILDFCILIN